MSRSWLLALTLVPSLAGQATAPRPKFEDYTVKQIFHGAPAPPILSKGQRAFRTTIREGAKSRVEFAGHYTVPRFGCGMDCSGLYIVDSVNGRVYDVPFSIERLPQEWIEEQPGDEPLRFEFHPDSRLFRVNGCINETNCGLYDYIMVDGKGLRLIFKQLLPEKYQHQH
jgi:hypothetical protein